MKASNYIKTSAASLALYGLVAFSAVCVTTVSAHAMSPDNPTNNHAAKQVVDTSIASGDFVRKSKRLSGSYEVIQRGGQTIIRFADNFNASAGPDLKVFLSPTSIRNASGRNATDGSIKLGLVKSTSGVQEYIVPAGVNIANFNSVLIHCEAYSVLWGGGDI